jgi:CHRD domain-containing protein
MKRVAILMAVLALAAGCDDNNTPNQPSNTGPIVFTSALTAGNEVPPVTNAESGGRGTATITFNVPRDSSGNITGSGNATFVVQLAGFPAGTAIILAHIHPGAAGATGSPIVNLNITAGAPILLNDGTGNINITVPIDQANAQNITAAPANFYFNVHTPLNGGGAARGQLSRTQ